MKVLFLLIQKKPTDVGVEKALDSREKKILQVVNLSPSESWIEKLVHVHPMRQITYASIIQVSVFFCMLGAFQVNTWIFST
jgi:hypothetical protein